MNIKIISDILISMTHFIVLILFHIYGPHAYMSTLPSFIECSVSFNFSESLYVYNLLSLLPPPNLRTSYSFYGHRDVYVQIQYNYMYSM